nr:MAG TPA: hypothetical protein [Caudoviricetes sp.]
MCQASFMIFFRSYFFIFISSVCVVSFTVYSIHPLGAKVKAFLNFLHPLSTFFCVRTAFRRVGAFLFCP